MTEQLELFKTSWAVNKGFQFINDYLNDKIPLQGKVSQGRSVNKKLEHFRVAQNLIYDLYNNGLVNRYSQFIGFFSKYDVFQPQYLKHDYDRADRVLEPIFTKIMLDAYKEQKAQDVARAKTNTYKPSAIPTLGDIHREANK